MKTLYVAHFAGGETVSRSTHRTYTHAWRVTAGGAVKQVGFAGSRQLAERAADSAARAWGDGQVEVVEANPAPEGFEAQCRRSLPWRVSFTYPNDRGRRNFVKGAGAAHRRFATRGEAQAEADRMNESSRKRGSVVTYEPTDE